MNLTSTTKLDQALKDLVKNEMGIVLLSADGENEEDYEKLSEKNHYTETLAGYAGKKLIGYRLYPLNYSHALPTPDMIEMRNDAIQNIFARWSHLGHNNSRARDPYTSKKFGDFLDSLQFTKADYLLMRIG